MRKHFNLLLNRIFQTATRPFELLNSLYFMSYSYIFWQNGNELYAHYIYSAFQKIPLWLVVWVFGIIGLLQFALMWRNTSDSNIVSGYLNIVCSIIWAFVYAGFSATYPPINAGMIHSGFMFAVCLLMGKYMIDQAKIQKSITKNKGAR